MMRRVYKVVWVTLVVFACWGTPLAAQTPSFQITSVPADFGNPVLGLGVSADGSVLIGTYFISGTDPACAVFGGCTRTFRWTAQTGVQDLGLLDGHEAEARALSADGSQIVGDASASTAFRRAFIWTAATGMQDLGTLLFPNDPDHSVSRAFGISSTGSVIVGEAIPTQTSLIPQSFRFTTAAGFAFLTPTLPNDFQSQADGVSDDGAVVVGRSYDSTTFLARAFRWKAGVIQDLGNVAGPPAYAFAASSDGSVVVGQSGSGSSGRAFRWTAAGGMQDLGTLGGDFASSSAAAVSADGTVIVGTAENLTTHIERPYLAVVPTPVCAPVTCASLGRNCGTISDGCGGTLNCGACTAPQICGGGGVANVCGGGCTPTTCAAQGKNCGAILDGCGGWIACGTCAAPQMCGGGVPNVCANPPPVPRSVRLTPNPVVGGNPATGTVTISVPAPPAGALVAVHSASPTLASVPPNMTVPVGATSASFPITTTVPASDTVTSITTCLNGQCAADFLFISRPTPPPAVTVSSLALNPASVVGGNSSLATATLSGPAPVGGVNVIPGSTNPVVANPTQVFVNVPAGATSATFTVATSAVTVTQTATISASIGGVGANAVLTVTPTSTAGTLTSLTLSPASVTAGSSSLGTVTLSTAAPASGAAVTLSSSNTGAVTVPPSVTVPAGSSSATFTVSTLSVGVSTPVTISASFGGATETTLLTVTPPPPPAADTVTIQVAEYAVADQVLAVEVTSTSSSATLNVFVTSTGALIGTLTNKGGGKYTGELSWSVNPQNITVKSSLGGSATKAVVAK